MGYQVVRRVFALTFEEFPGAEIQATSVNFGTLLDLGDQVDRLQAGAGLAGVRDLIAKFVASVRSWNFEDDGVPLEVSQPSFYGLDPDLAMAAVKAWVESMTSVSASLGKGSTNGRPSAPPSLTMEPL